MYGLHHYFCPFVRTVAKELSQEVDNVPASQVCFRDTALILDYLRLSVISGTTSLFEGAQRPKVLVTSASTGLAPSSMVVDVVFRLCTWVL